MDEAPPQEQEEEEEGKDDADVAPTTSSARPAGDWLQLTLGTTPSPRQPPPPVAMPELRLSEPPGPSRQDPTRDMRVIPPPPRQTGLWLMLQVQQSQGEQPSLPQIARNYLRIRDGGMTVRLLIKYLVTKLSLEDESEKEDLPLSRMLIRPGNRRRDACRARDEVRLLRHDPI